MVRQFSLTSTRSNLVSDLYISELKNFRPTPISTADAESATKPWKLPTAAKVPALDAEGADSLTEYESAKVEVVGSGAEGSKVEEYVADDWFVFEEEVEPSPHHH
ncbi:unnamed protein product [Ambrosiozyma monospora]|uniref:Unnamed protein product n=1 Tax=Ambrosiozyma monospora TaxID=43982 RepID=A0ACB5T230_AMBMO|nr:unnamed protein product [Ambrosiozyma monospora]